MKFIVHALTLALATTSTTSAFVQNSGVAFRQRSSTPLNGILLDDTDDSMVRAVDSQLDYQPGAAKTDFAKKYGALAGQKVKTVAEAFSDFTLEVKHPINALYKNAFTDLVGSTHLIVVNARFQKDPVWSLGVVATLELILKSYPDPEIAADIRTSFCKSLGLNLEEIEADAKIISDWAVGKTSDDVIAALKGEGDSPLAAVANAAKADEYWMYSRYFGVGLLSVMDTIGLEMEKDKSYTIMSDWVGTAMGKPYITACNDSDMFFKTKAKLDMMETLMKEIEIREKKKMATRLEEKAEMALKRVERDAEMKKAEAAEGKELAETK